MRFLRDWISFISPRSQLAVAIQTRLAAMEQLANPFELENVPLLRGSGREFEFTPVGSSPGNHSSFFLTKSRISDGPAGGVVVPLPSRDLFFLGIRQNLLEQAARQQL